MSIQAEQKRDASIDTRDLFTERSRKLSAVALVFLALIHLHYPDLKIDGVFLGLLGLAGILLVFDIESIQWLGIRAKRRVLEEATERVREVPIENVAMLPVLAPVSSDTALSTPDATAPVGIRTVHRPALDLLPPVDHTERLLWAVEQSRIELMLIAGSTERLGRVRAWSAYRIPELARELARDGVVPAALLPELDLVIAQRNELARGHFGPRVIGDSAADLAMELLIKLREIPRGYFRIRIFPVELFADRSLTTRLENGVAIEQIDMDGKQLSVHVYPTRHAYTPGRFVSWEWELSNPLKEEAWYSDPDRATSVLVFSESAWFVGREFPEQWGVEYLVGGPMRL